MKRHLSLLASVVLVVVMVFALASCEYVQNLIPGMNQTHDHKYVDGKCEVCGEADPNYKAPCEQHTYAEGVCTVCGAADPDYKPECAEHSFGAPVVTKKQTCTEKGERTFTCTVCGYADVKEIAPDGHKGGTATCQSKKICTVCGEAYGELGAHKDVVISAVEATCEKDGSTEGKMCEVCETILVQPEVIPGGHKGGEATCQAKAVCTVCGVAYGELGDHKYEDIPAVEPTCTEPGSMGGSKCSVCGEYEKDADGNDLLPETLNALGHNFVEGQCERCRLYHEDYKGVKTHYFIFSDLAEGEKDKTPVLGTLAHGYYTVNGNVVQRIDSKGYHSIELGKFGTGAISFTVTGTAHVEIELSSTGGSNTSWIGLIDEDGNLIANNEEKYSVTGASKGWTVFTWDLEAGTYYVVSPDVRIPILDENGNPVLDEDGNPTYEKIDPDDEDSKSIEVDPATGLPLVNDNGEKIAYNRGMRLRYISVTETPAEEEDGPVEGIIDVEVTNTHAWEHHYTFTAEAEGAYTFTLPAGLGLVIDGSNYPEVDYYNNAEGGAKFTVLLNAGESFGYNVTSATAGAYAIKTSFVACDVEDAPVVSGGFTGSYIGTDDWGNTLDVEITDTTISFQPVRSPAITWTYELEGDAITLYLDGQEITNPISGYVTVVNGVPTTLGYNGYEYTLTRKGEDTGSGDEIPTKDLANGYNSVDGSSVNFVYTATEAGKLNLSIGAFLGECAITYTVNGDDAIELAAQSSVTLDLYAGDKVVVYVVTDGGYTTVTVAWDNGSAGGDGPEVEPDGTKEAPYPITSNESSVTADGDASNMIFYTFTATVDGYLSITYPNENSWVFLYDNTNPENNDTTKREKSVLTYVILADHTYVIGLGAWEEEEADLTVSVVIAACDHVWSDATCEKLSTCSNCGATTGDFADHTSTVPEEEVTCKNPDICGVCGDELSSAPHSFGEPVVIKPADCANGVDGLQEITCTVCGLVEEETIWGYHTMDETYVYPTCTTNGSYHGVCTVCGYEDSYVIEASGHTNYQLSCGESGVCWECGETFTKEHDLSEATCTEASFCYNCWQTFGEPIPHNYVDGVCTECFKPEE